ncbi:MAG: hypothetical protein ACREQW_13830 [Candidatus Binatia bacterium]
MNYSRILRVIGQVLEPLRPEAYEVVCYGNCYLVRCRVKEDPANKKEEEKQIRRLPAFLRLWREQEKPRAPEISSQETRMNVEFLYSLQDIGHMDEERRAPRGDSNAMPDPYSFSNTLRAVGEFVDHKPNTRLLFASNSGQEIVILYETGRGVRNMEEYPISMLYELWVKRYIKKKK